jgi:hypothetical protein
MWRRRTSNTLVAAPLRRRFVGERFRRRPEAGHGYAGQGAVVVGRSAALPCHACQPVPHLPSLACTCDWRHWWRDADDYTSSPGPAGANWSLSPPAMTLPMAPGWSATANVPGVLLMIGLGRGAAAGACWCWARGAGLFASAGRADPQSRRCRRGRSAWIAGGKPRPLPSPTRHPWAFEVSDAIEAFFTALGRGECRHGLSAACAVLASPRSRGCGAVEQRAAMLLHARACVAGYWALCGPLREARRVAGPGQRDFQVARRLCTPPCCTQRKTAQRQRLQLKHKPAVSCAQRKKGP